jgi:Rad3-related DNA helicase
MLPQSIIKFKQGFGRLIRSSQDKGVVIVMDSRINTRPYGQTFLHSLPLCQIKKGISRQLPKEIKSWLGEE